MRDRDTRRDAERLLAQRGSRREDRWRDELFESLFCRLENLGTSLPSSGTDKRTEANAAAQPAPADATGRVLAAGLTLCQVVPRLRDERETRGLTMRDMHEATGMTAGRLSRLENQIETNPTIGTLERLAKALGVRLLVTMVDDLDEPPESEPNAERQD